MFTNIPDNAVSVIEKRLTRIEITQRLIVRMLSLLSESAENKQALITLVTGTFASDASDRLFVEDIEYVKKTILSNFQDDINTHPLNL
ncbi:hypothetical protein AA471_23455 [Salmonella enterica subsp. enterica]|nr:hypothetical protein [Salmonella enterica subsp. enterica]ECI0980232.1 hypothetical protein [Salmonella enterica subsp. enterica serovar Newport]ECO0902332.1 hypothetical protein [Salmonella enterica subsp. enterica serovar Newport]EDQ2990912.1 hypothetical protein [Salmonella enterica subsp. enterica]